MYQYQSRRPYARFAAVSTPSLLGQVLGITAVGFVITAVAAYLFQGLPYGVGLIAMLVGFGLLFAISGTRANPGLSLTMFYLFTLCEGVGIAPVIGAYVRGIGPDVVYNAAATTGLGMAILAAIVYATSFDFRRLSGIAFGALLALIVVGLISAFTHFLHPATYAWLTLAVFTLLVLIDFARIRAGGDGLTPVQMAVSIYLDSINIFLALLQLFGMRSRDD
jgi:modulator of FtsH protease